MRYKHKLNRHKRNQEIRRKYDYLIRVMRLQPHYAKNKLAREFRLSYATIEDIIYKQ